MLTFYYSTGTCSTASRIALEEAGLPYKGIEVSWQRNVNVAELGQVNPLGQVPVLLDEGRVLTQGVAILEYIANRGAGQKLLPPPGSWERSQALSWLTYVAADYQKSFPPVFAPQRYTNSPEAQVEVRKYGVANLEKHLAHIERSLEGKEYLVGGQFSVADAYLFVVTGWCKAMKVAIGPSPNIRAYMKRIYDRPLVQKVLASEGLLDYLPE